MVASQEDTWQSGGEEWPDAYRHGPMHPDKALGCVVVFWHEGWEAPAFQVYTGLLFGLPLAVTSFNRYSRLAESLGRRLTYSLVSMYFDDASILDWKSRKGPSQAAFASAWNQPMWSTFESFLKLIHGHGKSTERILGICNGLLQKESVILAWTKLLQDVGVVVFPISQAFLKGNRRHLQPRKDTIVWSIANRRKALDKAIGVPCVCPGSKHYQQAN